MSAAHLTTKQATDRAGVSRFALTRAQKSGDLYAIKNNKGRWLWDVEALDAWAAEKPAQAKTAQPVPAKDQERIQDLAQALGRAEGKAETLQTALEKMQKERDEERKRADALRNRSLLSRIVNT